MLQRQVLDERCSSNDPGRFREPRANVRELPTADESHDPSDCRALESCPTVNVLRRRLEDGGQPPYFPQPGDDLPAKPEGPMDSLGPWATGRPVYSPTAGMTGVRPVVDRYSMTRYSPAQWRAHNQAFFDQSAHTIAEARNLAVNVRQNNDRIYRDTDKIQQENRDRLSKRAGEIHQWKADLNQALLEITDEIELLEGERRRVKQSLSILTIPESISGEFLQIRSTRLEPDLVRDKVENELVKEVALCASIRQMLVGCRESIEEHLLELKTAKARLELDWTDKVDAYEIDSACVGLTNDSPLVLMRPGATRVPPEQSSPEGYQHFTREALEASESARKKSVEIRASLDAIFLQTVKDLRSQAAQVDLALAEQVNMTEQICQEMEKELAKELSDTERLIEVLRGSSKGLHDAMKVAQSRLSNRLDRRNVESCRDIPQFGLIEEVKSLNEKLSAMAGELERAEQMQSGLVKSRGDLEREIMVKRKTLYVDRDRGQWLRSFYPSAEALSGRV